MWQIAVQPISLRCQEVHVWRAALDVEPAALRTFEDSLSEEEQARAARFHSVLHAHHFKAGRGILRALLARYIGVPARHLRFSTNTHGKPSLLLTPGMADLRFNVSHSHGMALFAFALGREVGVDVEKVRPAGNEDRLAERFFSPREVAALRALPAGAQTEGFFHCWTRKEAYVKARGEGLSINLASFYVPLAAGELTALSISSNDDPEAARWSLRELAPGNGYVGAVASEGTDWSLHLWQWT
jgi:4'-phosphopantetheinyl transferase